MTTLETALFCALALGALWAWQNRAAISFALRNPTLVGAGSDIASGLSGLGVLS